MFRNIKKFFMCLIAVFISLTTSSCVAKAFEEEINVVFIDEFSGDFIGSDTVTRFKTLNSPELDKSYIPDGYKFFGWTPYNPNDVKATDPDFKEKYIGAGKMVHWADVEEFAVNTTVVLKSLMIDKTEIPVEYHYTVIAWYAKEGTSGINESMMEQFETSLDNYLRSINVSEEDINSILIRDYTGNVGPSTDLINDHGDVDIMLGWGSADNITSTGSIDPAIIVESVGEFMVGEKSRHIHLISEKETAAVVFEWMKSEQCRSIFA